MDNANAQSVGFVQSGEGKPMVCGVLDPKKLVPFVQDGHPSGREFRGSFVQARRCPCCAYVTFPSPDPRTLDDFYAVEYPKGSAQWYNYEADYNPAKTEIRSNRIIELVRRFGFGPNASLHEFGCAFGGTVDALNRKGFRATGTELNAGAVNEGRTRGNMAIHAESALDFLGRETSKTQIVYSYHAIEHFPDPFDFMQKLTSVMDPEGILIMVVPSSAARFALVYGHMRYVWFGYPEHLHLFSPRSSLSVAQRIGCRLMHVQSAEFGIEPAATAKALAQDSKGALALRSADASLLGEELIFVMARSSSRIAARYAAEINLAEAKALSFGNAEQAAMDASARKTVDPWVSA
jgi:SAM-dependent methyltransferase